MVYITSIENMKFINNNILFVFQFCMDYETSDKSRFPTFARTRPPDTQISKSVVSLLLNFNWTQVNVNTPNLYKGWSWMIVHLFVWTNGYELSRPWFSIHCDGLEIPYSSQNPRFEGLISMEFFQDVKVLQEGLYTHLESKISGSLKNLKLEKMVL